MQTADKNGVRKLDRSALKTAFGTIGWPVAGKVTNITGTIVEAFLPSCQLGTVARIGAASPGTKDILAEVVGFRDEKALLLPYTQLQGIASGAKVHREAIVDRIPVGEHLLGRVVDPFMRPIDGLDPFTVEHPKHAPLEREAPNPLARKRIEKTLSLGVRAMDSLLSFGEGQRIGIMAGSGVGKSVLMGMIARGSEADVNVIGLIGERGREVKEFLEKDLGPEGLKRSVVVCVTSDQSPLMRIRGAKAVTAISEYFSHLGNRVLLFMDSLTRVAMAQREIGLAIGEPPTTKGYPPSVFSLLPRLLERCGPQAEGHGSISGLYTVLVDGDDFNDPMPDAARAILDGHINLSRSLAAKGHFPAIDITTSASRVMYDIVSKDHWTCANYVKSLMGVYQENYDYIQIGSYQPGTNPILDQAINIMPKLEDFLTQDIHEPSDFQTAQQLLAQLCAEASGSARQ